MFEIGTILLHTGGKVQVSGSNSKNKNDIHEKTECRINMGNACYYSLDKILLSCLFSKKLKVNTYKTIILPVVLHGCETWFQATTFLCGQYCIFSRNTENYFFLPSGNFPIKSAGVKLFCLEYSENPQNLMKIVKAIFVKNRNLKFFLSKLT